MKDSIRRRGENVSAAEVEREVVAHPGIAEAAVIGIAAAVEQEVMAFLVPAGDEAPAPEAVIAFLEDRLPYYAVPRYLEYVESLPADGRAPTRQDVAARAGSVRDDVEPRGRGDQAAP